jgi:hypothetical protein
MIGGAVERALYFTLMMRSIVLALVMSASGSALTLQDQSSSAGAGGSPVACVAIVLPGVQGVEGSATDAGTAVRDLFMSFLTGPSIKAVALDARLQSQAVEEARQKQCEQVLIATLTRTRSGGSSRLGQVLGQTAGTAAWQIPYAGGTGGAVARSAAIASAQAVSTLAGSTRAKDEMRLEYRVMAPGNVTRVGPGTEKAKAKVDGEDLLTPLVQRAAETIAAAISTGKR